MLRKVMGMQVAWIQELLEKKKKERGGASTYCKQLSKKVERGFHVGQET